MIGFSSFWIFNQLVACVLAVVLMDNRVEANDYFYRAALPYRTRSVQPVSNSIASNNYYNPYTLTPNYNTYNPYAALNSNRWAARPVQYKWKLDFDDSVEDFSDSRESTEVYRFPSYRRF